ncbi:16S rRNA (guanine(527)-N(7))-methyltransferase RsmG [[Clostridium] symbiosum]|uniref:16S rRNA (guanine(527)-N(7))-methyltransferase RsmG n=1 Tax=Clostridium symbiosum TaxID=1512 RepID=UPI001D05FF6B|nr:16S rRNA (guanine(527)-N(7))-methyltransferase RsmG [[Clostridium] symbiosum]MCB6610693.1 16S rRNA (guanine(527)-N(7))-methyltransferase RsmG [[Clostridium] symbiosum]MCB6931303.1 16S rRNA (guanine(527)-N(7))-methyltransferase RsmG [[Clostridium] symbiosum]
MKDKFAVQLKEEVKQMGIELADHQIDQFYQYYELLIHWNSMVNLTAITQMEEVVTKHFVDSLSLKKIIVDIDQKPRRLIDVGTGAGFPGIPLKIVFPELEVTLLDSLNKRVKFLNEVIENLQLTGITAVHGRAEDLGRDNVSRETYDLCVSRAVANLATLSEYCMPFVKTGGYFIPYKSGKLEEELVTGKGAVNKLSGEIEDILTFTLPNADERCLVKIRKTGIMSKKYPRKAGMPSKEPLK